MNPGENASMLQVHRAHAAGALQCCRYCDAMLTPPNARLPDFSFKPVEWNDESQLYGETMALKQKNPNLKVLIAVGGWTMNDVRRAAGLRACTAPPLGARAMAAVSGSFVLGSVPCSACS